MLFPLIVQLSAKATTIWNLQLPDNISFQNSLFVKDCFEKKIPNSFNNYLQNSRS